MPPRPALRATKASEAIASDEDLHALISQGVSQGLRISVIIHALMTCIYQTSPGGDRPSGWEPHSIKIFGPGNYFQVRGSLLEKYFKARARGDLDDYRVSPDEADTLTLNSLKLHYFESMMATAKRIKVIAANKEVKYIDGKTLPIHAIVLVIYDQGVPYAFIEDAPVVERNWSQPGGRPRVMGAMVSTKMFLGIGDPNQEYDRPEYAIHADDLYLAGPPTEYDDVPDFIDGPGSKMCIAFESLYHNNKTRKANASKVMEMVANYLSGKRVPSKMKIPEPRVRLPRKKVRWS